MTHSDTLMKSITDLDTPYEVRGEVRSYPAEVGNIPPLLPRGVRDADGLQHVREGRVCIGALQLPVILVHGYCCRPVQVKKPGRVQQHMIRRARTSGPRRREKGEQLLVDETTHPVEGCCGEPGGDPPWMTDEVGKSEGGGVHASCPWEIRVGCRREKVVHVDVHAVVHLHPVVAETDPGNTCLLQFRTCPWPVVR